MLHKPLLSQHTLFFFSIHLISAVFIFEITCLLLLLRLGWHTLALNLFLLIACKTKSRISNPVETQIKWLAIILLPFSYKFHCLVISIRRHEIENE